MIWCHSAMVVLGILVQLKNEFFHAWETIRQICALSGNQIMRYYVNTRTTYIQMDDTLISNVHTRSVTSRVHEKFFKFFYNQREVEC